MLSTILANIRKGNIHICLRKLVKTVEKVKFGLKLKYVLVWQTKKKKKRKGFKKGIRICRGRKARKSL